MKTAVTVEATFIVMVQALVPEQAPDQPANVELGSAAAVKETVVPESMRGLQIAPQLNPDPLAVTVPPPLPDLLMVRVFCVRGRVRIRTRLLACSER